MRRVLLALLLTALPAAGTAVAAPINCTTNVAGCDALELSGDPYVVFFDNSNRYIDLVSPFSLSLDLTTTDVSRNVGAGALNSGVLRVYSETLSTFRASSFASIFARDLFTVTGPGSGTVPVTARFTADGTVDFVVSPNGGGFGNFAAAGLQLCGPGGSTFCGGDTFGIDGNVPFTGPITSDFTGEEFLQHTVTFDVTIGVPFTVTYQLTATTQVGSTIDMLDTGTLDFDLPDGFTIRSVGGYGTATEPPPSGVPAPATWMLVGLGVPLLARVIRRTKGA